MHDYAVYLIETADGRLPRRTYIGCTNNLGRRLRQHNGELVGGARSTRGRRWRWRMRVLGFPTQTDALRFEWAAKHPQRSRSVRAAVPAALRRAARGAQGRAALLAAMATAHDADLLCVSIFS